MLKSTLQVRTKSRLSIKIGLVVAGMFFLVSTPLTVRHSLNILLHSDAETMGMAWAHHIEARLQRLEGMTNTDGTPNTDFLVHPKQFAQLIADVVSVGTIYQLDFINPVCLCETTIGGYKSPLDGTGRSPGNGAHHPHQHDETISDTPAGDTAPSPASIKHLFLNETKHPEMEIAHTPAQLPIDRHLVQSIINEQNDNIFIRNGNSVLQPGTYAEVYHPVSANGKPAYLLRALVDLDEKASNYITLITSSAIAVLILGILSFAYPTRKYFVAAKKQRATDARAHFLAKTDVLTGVANRNACQELAPTILEDARRNRRPCTLFLVDVNNFKTINDYYGHQAGDQVLEEVANVLSSKCGPNDMVARIGGDEFAILSTGDPGGTTTTGLDLPKTINVHAKGTAKTIFVTLSVGLARFPRDGSTLEELMQSADLALYAAKKNTNQIIQEFNVSMAAEFKAKIDLIQDFSIALSRDQIVPYYQPIVNMQTGRVEGFEALTRWNHPQLGVQTPEVFHEVFENQDIVGRLGRKIVDCAMRDMHNWREQNVPFGSVGVNIGDGDLIRPDLALNIASKLSRHNLPRGCLAIEVTENCMFGANKASFLQRLHELRALGCYIALDDFGTGYSSITQIKELPITSLKIDKSFVANILKNQSDQAIVQCLIDLGHRLNFKLIAEGIETRGQHDLLRDLGCHIAQGFYYSAPVPAAEVPVTTARINYDFDVNTSMKAN